MLRLLFGLWLVALLCLSVLGCRGVTEVTITDEGDIASLIAELIWFDARGYYGVEDTSGSGLSSPITPLYWWRERAGDPPFDLLIQMNSERDSAFVTVTLDVSGTLHNIALDTAMAVDTIHKEFNDSAIRYATFLKDTVESYHHGWRLVKISGVLATSSAATVAIDSVRIRSSSYPNGLYSDPLALVLLDDVFRFSPGEGVSLWVYGNDETAELYFHSWKQSNRVRWQLTNEGAGVYFGLWTTPVEADVNHSAFDMLQHETLWDDEYPYDCNVWLLPYVVE